MHPVVSVFSSVLSCIYFFLCVQFSTHLFYFLGINSVLLAIQDFVGALGCLVTAAFTYTVLTCGFLLTVETVLYCGLNMLLCRRWRRSSVMPGKANMEF